MPRVRSNVARLKRKKQVMKAAKGAFGARSKLWKAARRPSSAAGGMRTAPQAEEARLPPPLVVRINAAAHQSR